MLREIYEYRDLLGAFTLRNIQIKYKQTVMGFLWALFMPCIIVLSGVIVKFAMATISGKPLQLNEIASVSVKALPWAFFVGALKFAVGSLVGNMEMIKKIYFPREVFPLSYTIGQLFDFIVSVAAFAIILAVARIGVSIHLLWVPLIVLFLFLLTAGLGMLLSCGNLFFRDVRYIVDVILTFGIFFTPVFYDASMFGKWEVLLLLNPVASILENLNQAVILHQMPNLVWFAYSGIFSVVTFVGSWAVFHRLEPLFAERI